MDLVYLFNSLMRRKWLIIISTLIAVVIAFLLTLRQEKKFKSSAQMATGYTTSDQVKLKDENFNISEIDVKFNNIIEAMTSTRVLSMVAYNAMLHDLANPAKPYRVLTPDDKKEAAYKTVDRKKAAVIIEDKYKSQKLLSSYDPEERKILELMKAYKYDLTTFRKNVAVGRISRTDFVDIKFLSDSPELSAYVVNQIYTEFLRSNETVRTQQTVESIESLEKLVTQKREELDAKLDNLRATGTVDVSVESSSIMSQIGNFENRLADEKSNLSAATLGLQQITNQIAEMDRTNAKTTTSASTANAEIASIRSQMNAAYTDYTNKGSNDVDLYKKYTDLKAQYKAKIASMSSLAGPTEKVTKADLLQKKSDLELLINSAQQNVTAYEAKIRQLNSGIGAIASKGATNMALKKELDMAQQEYENIKSRYDAAVNSKIVPLDNYRQVLFGQPAVDPEPSKRLIILALTAVSMFIFCSVMIILLEYLDVSIKTPSQFAKTVGLRLIGVVNKVNMKKTSLPNIFGLEHSKETEKNATFREHLRKLRYELEINNNKIFLFTSTRRGEGKSTVIKALAHSLSMSKKKILIIDTNFTHNSLTKEFDAQPVLEGVNILPEDVNYEELKKLISGTSIENVDIIGCQGGEYTPTEILGDNNLLTYIHQFTEEYDYIMLEGAALNERSDSKELLQYADTVISVVSAKSSVKQTDKESINFLLAMNGKFSGAVLNYVEKENIDL